MRAILRLPAITSLLLSSTVQAENPEFTLAIRENRFHPQQLEVPANTRIKLIVHNQDATPEEFESYELNREKIIPGNSKATIFVGPLSPGEYPFFGEFHEQSAQGVLIVTPE